MFSKSLTTQRAEVTSLYCMATSSVEALSLRMCPWIDAYKSLHTVTYCPEAFVVLVGV
jgi:hypothetical protein